MKRFIFSMALYLGLAYMLSGCGRIDAASNLAVDAPSFFSVWVGEGFVIDLRNGSSGNYFDVKIDHENYGGMRRCYANIFYKKGVARVVNFWEDATPPGFMPPPNGCSEMLRDKVFTFESDDGEFATMCDQDKNCRELER